MEEQKKPLEELVLRYPILAIIFPTIAGLIAWKIIGVLWIGILIMTVGLISNYFLILRKKKD